MRDIDNNSYDIEMQPTTEKHLAKRIRYYHSEMDGYQIKKGVSYNKLGKNIVIFICTYDPIGDNRSLYTYKKYCAENKNLELEDGEISIILNSEGNRADINNSLACFLDYIKTGKSTDDFTKQLSDKVKEINSDTDWRDRHMTLQMKMDERYDAGMEVGMQAGMETGIEIGTKIKLIDVVIKKIKKNKSLEVIADELEEDVAAIHPIYDAVLANPEKSATEIYSVIKNLTTN